MMQGDGYSLPIEIFRADGTRVTDPDVADVEVTLGPLRKTYKRGEVTFCDGKWQFPVTQQETFSLEAQRQRCQVRVLWLDGTVEGVSLGEILVTESLSREVLE